MKAIVYDAPRRWRCTDLPDPEPAAGEVLLRVAAAGSAAPTSTWTRASSGPSTR